MAIYHFSAQIISRKDGRSAVAAAAYRAAAKLTDRTTGQVSSFTRKKGVDHHEVMLPPNAPLAFSDIEELWSSAEEAEKRKDAQLCREINIALPIELSLDQQVELIRAYVKEQFVSAGMIAQVNVHDSQSDNPHAHVMLTLRDVTSNGFGNKNRAWNDKQLLEKWREQWANYANKALEKAGFSERIDHRTLEAQDVDRAPTKHLGPAISAILERGEHSIVYDRMLEQQAAAQALIDERVAAQREYDAAVQGYADALLVIEKAQAEAKAKALELSTKARLAPPPPQPPASGGDSPKVEGFALKPQQQQIPARSQEANAPAQESVSVQLRERLDVAQSEFRQKRSRLLELEETREELRAVVRAPAQLAKAKPIAALIDKFIALDEFTQAREAADNARKALAQIKPQIKQLAPDVESLARHVEKIALDIRNAERKEAQAIKQQAEEKERQRLREAERHRPKNTLKTTHSSITRERF